MIHAEDHDHDNFDAHSTIHKTILRLFPAAVWFVENYIQRHHQVDGLEKRYFLNSTYIYGTIVGEQTTYNYKMYFVSFHFLFHVTSPARS